KQKEKVATAERVQKLRERKDESEKQKEKVATAERVQKLRERKDESEKQKEKVATAERVQKLRANKNNLKRDYEKGVSQRLDMCCGSCKKIAFFDSGVKLTDENDMTKKIGLKKADKLCYGCNKSVLNEEMPVKCWLNNLEIDDIPAVLRCLNFIERRFICQVQTYMTLLKLPGEGQYAQDGLAIHFPSDPEEIVKILPHGLSSAGIVCISGKSEDFIRPAAIFAALKWLKQHNRMYKDIVIDCNALEVNEDEIEEILTDINETGAIPTDYDSPSVSVARFLKRSGLKVDFPKSESNPVSFADKKFAECMAFPWLFPKANGDFDSTREKKIPLLQYLQSRILHRDNRFRCDIPYLIVATNRYERQVLQKLVNFYVTRVRKSEKTNTINSMVPVTISDVQNLANNPDLACNSLMFTKQIRGTGSYWKDKLWDLLAKMKCLGPPDLFLTLSCADLQWPELEKLLQDDLDDKYKNMAQGVRCDPVIPALYADKRFREFIKWLQKSRVLGEIADYHARVEFQNRGSVHFHLFLWIPDAPSLYKGSSAAEIVKYIDRVICTRHCNDNNEEDDDELRELIKLQVHNHTNSCRLKNNRCRHHFPRRVCSETKVLYTGQRSSAIGNFYETKRDDGDEMVNAFNPEILRRFRSNMDIQLVNGEKGLAFYVLKYAMKAEPEEFKTKLVETLQNMDTAMNLTQQGRMMMLGMCQLKTRKMSAQEAAYRICDVDMVYSNRQVKKISTLPPERRLKRLNMEKLADKKEDGATLQDVIDDCFDDNMIDVYRKRPIILEKLSLSQFVSWYEKKGVDVKPKLVLLDRSGSLHKRRKALCLRTSHLSMNTQDYYYSLLLLHLPHRKETELLDGHENAEDAFLEKETLLDQGDLKSERIMNEVIETAQRLRTSLQLLDQMAEMDENDDDEEIAHEYDAVDVNETEPDISIAAPDSRRWTNLEERQWQILTVGETTPIALQQRLNSLSKDQLRVMKYFHWKLYKDQSQIQLLLTGNAGTGKSLLLEVAIEWFRLTQTSIAGQDPVMIGAPTGLAAKNINGETLHSLLKLPVQHSGYELDYNRLQYITLQNLRSRWANKKFLIVDEISMVGEKMMLYINGRLQEIFDNDEPFGGIHIIFAGDYFQLPPVKDTPSYRSKLIEDFDAMILQQNMRQNKDKLWCDMLDKIRIGAPLNRKEFVALNERVFPKEDLKNVTVDLTLYPTKVMVKERNNEQQEELMNSEVIEFTHDATDIYSNNDIAAGCSVDDENIPDDDRDAGGLVRELRLSRDSKVMLVKNLG
ncbi:MAG: AAA family ATPase, partial [Pseudoalteromonas sp.]|nr:AAA family ATPase [Pseudoalteromonas sp.]